MKIDLAQIMEGHMKEFLNMNDVLSESRLEICKKCPLYKNTSVGYLCDNELWLNPETGKTSVSSQPGYFKGCKCRLKAKTRLKDAKCPAGKW